MHILEKICQCCLQAIQTWNLPFLGLCFAQLFCFVTLVDLFFSVIDPTPLPSLWLNSFSLYPVAWVIISVVVFHCQWSGGSSGWVHCHSPHLPPFVDSFCRPIPGVVDKENNYGQWRMLVHGHVFPPPPKTYCLNVLCPW